MESKNNKKILIIIAVFSFLILLITYRLFYLQVVKGKEYNEQSNVRMSNSEIISAPRGNILDRVGRPIVTNENGFLIEIKYSSDKTDEQLNKEIFSVISLFRKYGEPYKDSLEISYYPFEYLYENYSQEKRKELINELSLSEDKKKKLSANDKIVELKKKYNVSKEYNLRDARDIIGVRYEMEKRMFSYSNPFVFSADANINMVSEIKENTKVFQNIHIKTQPKRNYLYDGLASHILGRVGLIYREEYEEMKDKGYSFNSIIGKDGLEKYLEPYIKGKDGLSSVKYRVDGNVEKSTEEIPAIAGDNAILTIDLELQKAVEEALKNTINRLYNSDNPESTPRSGSVVCMDVNTGDVLALANYPTYSLKNFDKDYDDLYKDPAKPMFNRAISGTYAPGSTFKMLTAIAGLEEGKVTYDELIKDEGRYKLFDHYFNCWIWSQSGATHGFTDVAKAISESCNYYFYEVGNRLGVDAIVDYTKLFGLGQKTGIELEGESSGVIASPEFKEKSFDEVWYPGDTVQSAIGQSYNLFTPIQLASYVSTIANGGTRYKTHLVKSVIDPVSGKYAFSSKPEVVDKLNIKKENLDAVKKGMRSVASVGTASSTFGSFPIKVCAKTGSAQVVGSNATGLFVAFAPYDKPEIAIAVVVENAGSGSSVAPVAKAAFAQYFGIELEENAEEEKIEHIRD
ncbi:MAG: penicillin-binding protein 2 [Ruminococcaceae bacterium]|nr:penicillin-binding protein 2 [Oscillospiraceae bacterium]